MGQYDEELLQQLKNIRMLLEELVRVAKRKNKQSRKKRKT